MSALRSAAHGKVILLGEHAVVYGVPALAVGIDRGAWAEVRHVASDGSASPLGGIQMPPSYASPLGGIQMPVSSASAAPRPSTLDVREWNISVSDDMAAGGEAPPLARALCDLLAVTRDAQREAGQQPVGAVKIDAGADLPPGGGLGCSAALGVAVARAIDPRASSDDVAARVMVWERVFHGNPSGIDAAVASLGGCVSFRKEVAPQPPTIECVRVPTALHLCIGQTGQASSTKSMVEAVARIRERRPETTQRTFDAIHTLVKNARLAIEAGDVRAVGQLLDLNQMLLSGLFVSTPEIEQMCASARNAGALGAKLTGAGGGGCVVALVDGVTEGRAVLEAWKSDGFDGFAATVGGASKTFRETLVEHGRVLVSP